MDKRDIYIKLIQDLVWAPGSEEGWRKFLLDLSDAVQGATASIIAHELSPVHCSVAISVRADPSELANYQKHWAQFDPWARSPRLQQPKPGDVVTGDALISRSELSRTAFFNDFGVRNEVTQCLTCMVDVSSDRVAVISVNRGERAKRFGDRESSILSEISTHLRQALAIQRRLDGAEIMTDQMASTLDELLHGVIFVTAGGKVQSANRSARQTLRERDGLSMDQGFLRGATPSLTDAISEAIGRAVKIAGDNDVTAGAMVALGRPSGRRPLSFFVVPLPQKQTLIAAECPAAAVFLTDPEKSQAPPEDLLRSAWQLTSSEARLVQCLVNGLSLDESAGRLNLQTETIRKRIKIIFEKTDTHRQSELIRLVVSSLPPTRIAPDP